MDYASAATEKMELYRRAHPGSPSAVRLLDYFFVASFGSHCWGQASKKALSVSALRSRQPCARSMRNTWLASVRRLRP